MVQILRVECRIHDGADLPVEAGDGLDDCIDWIGGVGAVDRAFFGEVEASWFSFRLLNAQRVGV